MSEEDQRSWWELCSKYKGTQELKRWNTTAWFKSWFFHFKVEWPALVGGGRWAQLVGASFSTTKGCRFDPWLRGWEQEATDGCFSFSLSVSQISKHILRWGLKKRYVTLGKLLDLSELQFPYLQTGEKYNNNYLIRLLWGLNQIPLNLVLGTL